MSNLFLINYADGRHKKSVIREAEIQEAKAIECGFKESNLIHWNFEKISKTEFYKSNQSILDVRRGAGLWLWKPYIIYETLKKVNYGDIVIYSDTDIYFERYPQELIDICDKFGYFFRRTIFKHKQYTKRECMISMDADTQDFYESFHITAGFQLLKKNHENINFIKDWLDWSCKKHIIDDSRDSNIKQLPTFKDHRHDLSIFSILHKKRNLLAFNSPGKCMFDFYNLGLYDTAFNSIERKENETYLNKRIINGQI